MLSPSSLSHCSILSRILVTESEIDVMRNVPSKDKNQRSNQITCYDFLLLKKFPFLLRFLLSRILTEMEALKINLNLMLWEMFHLKIKPRSTFPASIRLITMISHFR